MSVDDKQKLRNRFISWRHALSDNEVANKSGCIVKKVLSLNAYNYAKTVFIYIDARKEVQTRKLITHALQHGKRVVVPICTSENEMQVVKIFDLNDFHPGRFGIAEPPFCAKNVVDPQQIDLVIAPGVAFDRNKTRLGHGLGFFDRYLHKVSPNTVLIGICYEELLVPVLPHEEHDVKMHMVITDKEILL